jgi:hypothetical protein
MRALALIGFAVMLMPGTNALAQDTAKPVASVMPTVASSNDVNPESVAALRRMSDYLMSLKTFRLTAQSSLDVVTVDNQRVQMDATVNYKLMRPGIFIDYDSDQKARKFIYDGKQFTIYAPKLDFYATVPAPPTNREFLQTLYDKTGIELPLEDLFRWNDGDDSDIKALTSGFSVGTARIDGAPTDHWAFRGPKYDWEVWIQQGDQPLPRKLVIIDRTDPTYPTYTARLTWTPNAPLSASDFAFVPDKDAKRIQVAQFTPEDKQ